ncbi:unnamed protein product [Kluyveromyces dobzhanskii CBS 2104]|uniref:1,3-beta-glucanosyltransferase n=1 Tax=Kluyveromyces dobzhanskii CBS 2104 TaxID=1427455 RepID=A0A0A8L622_9SACH|nr:unnamed protein product [Kluyveromyces dobzhanskii CBS 2104]
MFRSIIVIAVCIRLVLGKINPIEVRGKHFYDSVSNAPFFIRGIDYQPGGSSDFTEDKDPLSDTSVCARDIPLFQNLGINAVRVYSLNPDLNHDKCMTMLASAGIYLILDVNSPLTNQHLNRYEPWTTYNPVYLEHVFKVVEQFSSYNNTLGFIAGNEIINDKRSAERTPPYIKQLVIDIKGYIKAHSSRVIPVGYSAADDLKYRVSLSKYLECEDQGNHDSSVDFYGVNSYQWCGDQDFQSSGYDKLVDAYKDYSKPVFFSEFGCNEVTPRKFGEIPTLYSDKMYHTFSGGLVYEFTQETNNYGLVSVDEETSDVYLLEDFDALKNQYTKTPHPTVADLRIIQEKVTSRAAKNNPNCYNKYTNLDITAKVVPKMAAEFIRKGVKCERGKYVDLDKADLVCNSKYFDAKGNPLSKIPKFSIVNEINSVKLTEPESKNSNSASTLMLSTTNLIIGCSMALGLILDVVSVICF